MHLNNLPAYTYVENFNANLINNIAKKVSIIYRNYKETNIDHILRIRNLCKKTGRKFYLSNNVKLAIKLSLDGAYIPSFNKSLKNLIKNINSNKKTIVGLGAAPRSCVLINSVNLNSKYIKFIGEVPNSLKCNKYMPGTDILVKNENLILKLNIDYILILAWHLKSRMIKIFKKNKFKGKFIVPLPKLSIFK